jgi:hypothetical protein
MHTNIISLHGVFEYRITLLLGSTYEDILVTERTLSLISKRKYHLSLIAKPMKQALEYVRHPLDQANCLLAWLHLEHISFVRCPGMGMQNNRWGRYWLLEQYLLC